MTAKTYMARTFGAAFIRTVTGDTPLPPRLDLRRHSPTGFSWGMNSSGSAQLALAILCDAVGTEKALRHYQRFKELAIAKRMRDAPFVMTLDEVLATMKVIEGEELS